MNNVDKRQSSSALAKRWRRQVDRQRHQRELASLRDLAAIGYLINGPIRDDNLVDVRGLVQVVVHDHREAGLLRTRVAGYKAAGVPWGVKIGGPENHLFEKDLLERPMRRGRGRRLGLGHPELLALALRLDRELVRRARYPYMPCAQEPRWPQLWAAIEPAAANRLRGSGPEFETWQRMHPGAELPSRRVLGIRAFPLAFVGHASNWFITVVADLRSVPKRQVFTLGHELSGLKGFRAAVEYDLVDSRFSVVRAR